MTVREDIERVVRDALEQAYPSLGGLKFEVYRPRERAFGDFATNVALLVGKSLGKAPLAVAEGFANMLRKAPAVAAVEIARPGFINILVSSDIFLRKLEGMVACEGDESLGSAAVGEGRRVQVEFVSANPTGPLNVVSARAAAVGDSLVRLLRRIGYDTRSEFYVNDSGTQFELLGASLAARFRELLGEKTDIPENGYPGEYLIEIAYEVKRLADWADSQAETWADLEEPDGRGEPEAVERFLSQDKVSGADDPANVRTHLREYLDLKQALGVQERRLWAALYLCRISELPMGAEAVSSRLASIARYRSFLGTLAHRGGRAGDRGDVRAPRVFLGSLKGWAFNFSRFAVERIVEGQRASLARFGSRPEGGPAFDAWVRESSLKGTVSEVMTALLADGRFVCERDGAVWLKGGDLESASESGVEAAEKGEKDEWVIRRKTGQPTYFLADIAYHVDKRRRGFDRVIDIWGPDHHGHVGRMKTAMRIASLVAPELGIEPDWLEILIAQQVNLIRDGKRIQMSKRAGEYVTLDDVVSEVGADAARFFFLMRRSNSHLDFDLDLAKKTSEENPVYYIQYAHARICSIIEFARASGFTDMPPRADLGVLQAPEEADLIKALVDFDDVVRASALSLEPHRVVNYLLDLAGRFHRFYHNHRVVTEDRRLSEARLCLSWAMRSVLRSGLSLVGVSAPASM